MADDGKSIADAYRNWSPDSAVAAPSEGASIADAYRAQAANQPPASTKKGWADYYSPTGTVDEYGNAQAPLATAPTPPSSLEDLRAQIQAGETNVLRRLASGPETGPVEDFARHAAGTGVVLLGQAAQLPLNVLIGLKGGAGPGSLTINPDTGTMNLTPEALTAAQVLTGGGPAGRDIRFVPRGGNPLEFVPPARSGGPLPPDTAANLLSPDARVRATEPPAGPTTSTGVPVTPPAPIAAPPAAAPPATLVPSGAVPMTSDAAKEVATAYYKTFDRAAQDGGSLTPQATNKFIASVEAAAPKPGIGQAVAGRNAITDLVERLQPYKDKPMSLQDVNDIDKQMGNLVSAEYGRTGVSDIGRQLQGIQYDFRGQVANPAVGDVVSGQAGIDALAPARKAYSQAIKLDTIERIQQRADMTDNPTTSVRTQIRTLLNNDRLSRGFTEEEKAALREAANRGATATALHIMGSRLFPLIAGGVGSAGGFFGAVAGGTAGHFLNESARWAEHALAARRMQNALSVVSKGVPPPP